LPLIKEATAAKYRGYLLLTLLHSLASFGTTMIPMSRPLWYG